MRGKGVFLFFLVFSCTPPAVDKVLVPSSKKEGSLLYRDEFLEIHVYGFKKAFSHWERLFYKKMDWARIPFLTYLYYLVYVKKPSSTSFTLFRSYLVNDLGEKFPTYSYEDFTKKFTSESYRGISYEKFFGFYRIDSRRELLFKPWEYLSFSSSLKGAQVIPYAFLSQGSRYYTLIIHFPWGEIQKDFFYRTIYEDL